jgi:hypothetical protein
MTYTGHVKGGQIVLDPPVQLPERTRVSVRIATKPVRISRPAQRRPLKQFDPMQMPGGSLSVELIRDRR